MENCQFESLHQLEKVWAAEGNELNTESRRRQWYWASARLEFVCVAEFHHLIMYKKCGTNSLERLYISFRTISVFLRTALPFDADTLRR